MRQQNCNGLLADKMAATDWVKEVRVKFKPDDEEVKDLQWTVGALRREISVIMNIFDGCYASIT